jgi:hypothetical protein
MNIGWGNEHGSKYRLRDYVPGRQDKKQINPDYQERLISL